LHRFFAYFIICLVKGLIVDEIEWHILQQMLSAGTFGTLIIGHFFLLSKVSKFDLTLFTRSNQEKTLFFSFFYALAQSRVTLNSISPFDIFGAQSN